MTPSQDPRSRLFVALDVPDVEAARALVARLGDSVQCYKIGLELLFGGGIDFAQGLKAAGKTVFLDMKLLDIPNTVEKATANIARLGFDYLTVHGTDNKTLRAAVSGRGTSSLKLLAVTVLTSLDRNDLEQQGIRVATVGDLVIERMRRAVGNGFDGVIASAVEADLMKRVTSRDFLVVTPGIRPAGSDKDDQARVMTPAEALRQGATHLVVGRPIVQAADPKAVADAIVLEIASAIPA